MFSYVSPAQRVPPDHPLRAQLLQVFYSIRSERLLMEQLDYNLLFRLGRRYIRAYSAVFQQAPKRLMLPSLFEHR